MQMNQGAQPAPSNDIEVKIRDFVARNLLFSENGFPHDDTASFLETGVIDSLGVLELVTFAGKEFGLEVDPSEVTPENFDSVSRLSAFIRNKQKQARNGCVSS
jgi:acyl carrier protein